MADKFDRQRSMPRRIAGQSRRRCRCDSPARGGRAGKRGHPVSQNERCDSRLFCRQNQPPARRQVERPGLPPGFDDDCPYACTSQNIGPGTQGGQRIGRRHENNPVRINAELHKTRPIKPTVLALALVFPQPENWPRSTGAVCQHQRETADGRMVIDFCGAKLMKRPARQPAPEPRIDGIAPERKKARPAARAHERAPRDGDRS